MIELKVCVFYCGNKIKGFLQVNSGLPKNSLIKNGQDKETVHHKGKNFVYGLSIGWGGVHLSYHNILGYRKKTGCYLQDLLLKIFIDNGGGGESRCRVAFGRCFVGNTENFCGNTLLDDDTYQRIAGGGQC